MAQKKAAQSEGRPDLRIKLRSWCHQWISVLPIKKDLLDLGGRQLGTTESDSNETNILNQVRVACQPDMKLSSILILKRRNDGKYDLQTFAEEQGLEGSGQQFFLAFIGRRLGLRTSSGLDTAFAIQFSDDDQVCFRGGSENLYLSADPQGRIYTGPTRPRRWEWFTMFRESQPKLIMSSPISLPVRVALRGHNGRYLCTSHPTVSAHAEVPCCCEELLLEVGPVPVSEPDADDDDFTWTTIRTASGDRLLSANTAGVLATVPLGSARGRENFLVHLTCPKWPRVAILHQTKSGENSCASEVGEMPEEIRMGDSVLRTEGQSMIRGKPRAIGRQTENERRYVGVDSDGGVKCNRDQPETWEQFTLELVTGSRVFIQGVNGHFLGGEDFAGTARRPVTCSKSEPSQLNGCWTVRSHGDGLYTLVVAPLERGRGEAYLFVDDSGRLQQSSEPSVQFSASCSLFLLEPVAQKTLISGTEEEKRRNPAKELLAHLSRKGRKGQDFGRVSDQRIVGFSIRTAGKVDGRERYLSVEPNGVVRASKARVGRSEVFAFSDVNALAARVDPVSFPCEAAACSKANPLQNPPLRQPSTATERAEARAAEEAAAQEATRANARLCQRIHVAALALKQRAPNPNPRPAKLQELCADAISTDAARRLPFPGKCISTTCHPYWAPELPHLNHPPNAEPKLRDPGPISEGPQCKKALLRDMVQALLGAAAPPCSYNGAFSDEQRLKGSLRVIPNDVLDQVDTAWRARQRRQHSCKWHVSSHRRLNRAFNAANRIRNRPGLADKEEGFLCTQCQKDGLRKLDPKTNPAHHRYLEVQQRLHGVNGPAPSAMWNLLTMTAVSMLSSILLLTRGQKPGRRTIVVPNRELE